MPSVYITGAEHWVKIEGKHLKVGVGRHVENPHPPRIIPLFDIDRVVVFGRASLSMAAVHGLMRHGISVHLHNRSGRLYGSFTPRQDGDASVRVEQYRMACDEPACLAWGASIVQTKIMNARRVLQKSKSAAGGGGDSGEDDDAQEGVASPSPGAPLPRSASESEAQIKIGQTISHLGFLARQAEKAEELDELRGFEGAAASAYYRGLSHLFPVDMPFENRNRRPPKDPVNALLSFTYTLVGSEIRSALVAAGLDPCIGVLHAMEYGRPSLALDLLEPLRGPLCDLLVLRLVKLRILGEADFENDERTGGVRLTQNGLKRYLLQYEKRMMRTFRGKIGEGGHTDFRQVVRDQAMEYRTALLGRRTPQFFEMP